MKSESLIDLLNTSRTIRCHTCPTLKHQTVGHHTYRTLVILHWLYYPAYPPASLTFGLLIHDMPELWTGDIPGDTKANNVDLAMHLDLLEINVYNNLGIHLPKITDEEQAILKVCDRADLYFWGIEEIGMGNKLFIPVMTKARSMTQREYQKWKNITATGSSVAARMELLMGFIE